MERDFPCRLLNPVLLDKKELARLILDRTIVPRGEFSNDLHQIAVNLLLGYADHCEQSSEYFRSDSPEHSRDLLSEAEVYRAVAAVIAKHPFRRIQGIRAIELGADLLLEASSYFSKWAARERFNKSLLARNSHNFLSVAQRLKEL